MKFLRDWAEEGSRKGRGEKVKEVNGTDGEEEEEVKG